jgi:hypothetical protein
VQRLARLNYRAVSCVVRMPQRAGQVPVWMILRTQCDDGTWRDRPHASQVLECRSSCMVPRCIMAQHGTTWHITAHHGTSRHIMAHHGATWHIMTSPGFMNSQRDTALAIHRIVTRSFTRVKHRLMRCALPLVCSCSCARVLVVWLAIGGWWWCNAADCCRTQAYLGLRFTGELLSKEGVWGYPLRR